MKLISRDLTAVPWDAKYFYWTVQHEGHTYIAVRQQRRAGRVAYKRWLGLDRATQGPFSYRTVDTQSQELHRLRDQVPSLAQAGKPKDASNARRSLSAKLSHSGEASQAYLRRKEERKLKKQQIRQQQLALLDAQLQELQQEENEDSTMDTA
ncbi:MAG: hypothetical protein Q9228_002150 [Teloschistes exilis]